MTYDLSNSPGPARTIEPISMRIPEACRFVGLGRSTLYLLIAQGEIETVKLGSSTFVLTESLKNLVNSRRTSPPANPGRSH